MSAHCYPRCFGGHGNPARPGGSCGRGHDLFCRGVCALLIYFSSTRHLHNLKNERLKREYGNPHFTLTDHPSGYDRNHPYRDPYPPSAGESRDGCDGKCGYVPCVEPFRKKYVCLGCKRTFKPSLIACNEYCYERADFGVCPARKRMPGVWRWYENLGVQRPQRVVRKDAWRDVRRDGRKKGKESKKGGGKMGWEHFMEVYKSAIEKTGSYRYDPGHWISLESIRCPGCGQDGQLVGGTFKPPAQKDEKGWAKIRAELDENPSRYSWCSTKEMETEKINELKRVKERKKMKKEWEQEKARRIAALRQLGADGS